MSITFPGESAEYRVARDRLLEQEISLRRATEAVAAARRDLSPGGEVSEDYVFQGEEQNERLVFGRVGGGDVLCAIRGSPPTRSILWPIPRSLRSPDTIADDLMEGG